MDCHSTGTAAEWLDGKARRVRWIEGGKGGAVFEGNFTDGDEHGRVSRSGSRSYRRHRRLWVTPGISMDTKFALPEKSPIPDMGNGGGQYDTVEGVYV